MVILFNSNNYTTTFIITIIIINLLEVSCIAADKNSLRISSKKDNGLTDSHSFSFDKIFDTSATQEEVFNDVKDLVLERYIIKYNNYQC